MTDVVDWLVKTDDENQRIKLHKHAHDIIDAVCDQATAALARDDSPTPFSLKSELEKLQRYYNFMFPRVELLGERDVQLEQYLVYLTSFLHNALDNATTYGDPRGKVTITWQRGRTTLSKALSKLSIRLAGVHEDVASPNEVLLMILNKRETNEFEAMSRT